MIVLNKKLLLSTLFSFSALLFSLNGFSQFNHDIGVTSVTTSSLACVANLDTLWVDIENFGNLPIDSFKVVWNINGAVDSSWFFTPILTAPNNSIHLQLDTFSLDSGINQITVATSLPNNNQDQNTLNDTVNTTINGIHGEFLNVDYCISDSTIYCWVDFKDFDSLVWDWGDAHVDVTSLDTISHKYDCFLIHQCSPSITLTGMGVCNLADYILVPDTIKPCPTTSTVEVMYKFQANIYPNPSSETLNVEIINLQSASIQLQLFNAKGGLIYSEDRADNSKSFNAKIDVSEFPKGLYLLRVKNGDDFQTHKIVIN